MYKAFFKYSLFIALLALFVVSCDNNFNELGSDIVGNDHFEYGDPETYEVTATNNKDLGAVESLDLPTNPLGIYDNPVFGSLKAHFATQIQLAALNPTFDTTVNPVSLDSVVLSIPYYSKKITTSDTGVGMYELDSIYGPKNGKIPSSKFKLHIYESKYYIRDLEPGTQETQKYYTNQNSDFPNNPGAVLLNDRTYKIVNGEHVTDYSQNEDFFFNPAENYEVIKKKGTNVDSLKYRTAPGIRFMLNEDFFKNKIFGAAAAGKLLNNNVFKEYFRGLYFNVEQSGSEPGNLGMINFLNGKITLYYKEDKSVPKKDAEGHVMHNADGTVMYVYVRVQKTLLLNLNGKSVSLHENTPLPLTLSDRLYIKGGDNPSMAVINLFPGVDSDGDGISDELEALRTKNWLVNDASLTFYIDNSLDAMGKLTAGKQAIEPNRIFLYDLKNKRPIVDYYSDQTTNGGKANYGKTTFNGIIKKVSDRGIEYKIRLTNHVRGLITKDSTNVQLGLIVTQNINATGNKKLKTAANGLEYLPTASVMNPFGTILYNYNSFPVGDPNYDKRLKLKIYFTKRKQD